MVKIDVSVQQEQHGGYKVVLTMTGEDGRSDSQPGRKRYAIRAYAEEAAAKLRKKMHAVSTGRSEQPKRTLYL